MFCILFVPLASKWHDVRIFKAHDVYFAKMQTSIPDIYAVGDAVEVKHFITDKDSVISIAGPANKQGRMLSKNKLTKKAKYDTITKINNYKWNQLTVENVGSFMLFRGKSYG